MDFIADLIHEIFDIYIDDYAYVKTKGFRNIVDYFGGVTVYVPVHMEYNDPYQDLEIYIEREQNLNRKMRKGMLDSDRVLMKMGILRTMEIYSGKNNQNRFIKAFISQHVTLKNLGRLSKIAEVISSNINTSVRGWDSIVKYGALAEEALNNKYPIENYNLQFTDKFIDGSSYVLIKTK